MNRTRAVLIIGGSGFIGTHLAMKLREGFKVFATYHRHHTVVPGVTYIPFDVDNRNWAKRVTYTAQPDIVIYAAGKNDAAWAEANTRESDHVHTSGPATVANVSDILAPKFIFLSNCYTFDGARGNYHETDIVMSANALGKSKLGGENFIRGRSLNYVIVRSSPLFGRSNGHNLNFFDRMRMSLDRGRRIELSKQEIHSFAPVDGLIDLVSRIVETGVRNKILHYGGLTKVSYYEFARLYAKRFGYDPELIHPLRNPSMRKTRPDEESQLDFSLNSTQVTKTLKIQPLLLEEGFDLIEKKLVPGA